MTSVSLSDQHLEQFRRQGYLYARRLFDAEEMQLLLDIAKSDHQLVDESYGRADGDGRITRLALRNDLDDSQIYSAIVRCQRVARTMERLLDGEVYHYHHKMMLKEPRVGGAWQWHQDYGYWYNNGCLYPDMASCLIAVDRATRANGCLQIIPGSHLFGRIDHIKIGDQVGADPRRVEVAISRLGVEYCEMESGDALFFHGNLLHRSDANTSPDPRWSLICCYNTRHNDPYITNGRHPNYSKMEIWPDSRVKQVGRQQLATLSNG